MCRVCRLRPAGRALHAVGLKVTPMRNRMMPWLLAGVVAVAAAGAAAGQERKPEKSKALRPAGGDDANSARLAEVQEQVAALRAELARRREALAEQPDVRQLVQAARQADADYQKVRADDEPALAARKAWEASEAARRDLAERRLQENEEYRQAQQQVDDAWFALVSIDKRRRQIDQELQQISHRLTQAPTVGEARKAYDDARQKYQRLPGTLADIVAAKAAALRAKQAWDEKSRTLPEYKAMREAAAAYDAAVKNSPDLLAARQAADRAGARVQRALEEQVAADPNGRAFREELNQLSERYAPARETRREAEQKLAALAKTLSAQDPAVQEAAKACEAARAEYDRLVAARTAGPRKARDGASEALDRKFREMQAADPAFADLAGRIAELDRQRRELKAKSAPRKHRTPQEPPQE